MRVQVVALLLVLAFATCDAQQYWRRTWWKRTVFFKRSVLGLADCKFNTKTLVCPSFINCEVEPNLTQGFSDYKTRFGTFGIGKHVDGHFDLFPQTVVGHVWHNSSVESGHHLALYHTPRVNWFGLRIVDATCWKNVTTHFNAISQFDTVLINGVKVNLIGYITFQ